MEVVINEEKLNEFCKVNNFVIITDDLLKKENMYKDLKYASDDNFVGVRVYPKNMPLIMNEGVWNRVKKANTELKQKGYCIMFLDAYRPIQVQRLFWDYYKFKNKDENEGFVANPNKYGTHNITINAIDIMPVKLDGSKIALPCEFDDFTEKASIYYDKCTKEEKENRDLFINILKNNGLLPNVDEWWHYYDERIKEYGMGYDYKTTKYIPLLEDETFKLI